ncbi:MAG: SH3 domain-containing protein [Opitutaceae bacterium]|nr:SH3 domain-containing protein [Opitutaceae bacterium]
MKISLLTLALSALAGSLPAAPLVVTTAVHTQPNAASPAIAFLKAGTEPVPSADASAPDGWLAIDLPGPFEGYVENKDLTKDLDVKPGTSIRLAPRTDAGVLVVAAKEDKTTITGLRGKWTQISLDKKLTGYISLAAPASPAPLPVGTAPAAASAPAAPGGPAMAGQPVTTPDGGGAALPRQFAGRFVSTRRPLAPRRPYDYALVSETGVRYAYLDVTRLLPTEDVSKFVDREVLLFGAPKPAADGKEIVVAVETIQLR